MSDSAIDRPQLRVALVNNMPDGAFVDTEDQFRRAVGGEQDGTTEVQLYTLPELPRSDRVMALIDERYRGLDQLWADPPDALIVTGTEPVQAKLQYEPYWPYLARLLEWAAASVPTTLLSCLAAHASALLFDEIERVPRARKCSGVFAGTVEHHEYPLAAGLPDLVSIPHSRVNDVPEPALIEAGYEIVIGSGSTGAGWAVACKRYGEHLFVLCQGHPEYSTVSLLREYRRDVRRFLHARQALPYPRIPDGYLSQDGVAILEEFAVRAAAPDGDPSELWEDFPFELAAATVQNTWAGPSATLYSNWLALARRALPASRIG